MTRALFIACALVLGSCAPRTLELALKLDVGCTVSLPAGSSVFYELVSGGGDGGPALRVCGACLAVDAPIESAAALISFLRASAPSCDIAREVDLTAQVTSFATAGCAASAALPASTRLCATSAPTRSGDGRGDQSLAIVLSCAKGCDAMSCVPVSCGMQAKDCGPVPDGCGASLDCGTCKPPEKCGGAGVANVCGR